MASAEGSTLSHKASLFNTTSLLLFYDISMASRPYVDEHPFGVHASLVNEIVPPSLDCDRKPYVSC